MSTFKQYIIHLFEEIELFRRHFVNPEKYVHKMFYNRMGYHLNLDVPTTYSEKLQWLKLYWHNPLLTTLVDKYAVKDYVAKQIGERYIIPTIGVWDNVSEIDWDALPNQFVLKCTHDSGGLVICTDKSKLNKKAAKRKLQKSLSHNYYYYGFEWPYKNVKPRIIAETYLHDSKSDDLADYKFFCFNGVVKAMFVATERNRKDEEVKFDFYDADFNHLPFTQGHPNSRRIVEKNSCFEKMKELASELSKDLPHARVDFYEINGKIYFGEMTFFHHGGWTKFEPKEWDYTFGEWLSLPNRI